MVRFMTIENDKVTFEDKIVGVVKSVKIIDGNTHYEIEITDQDLIDKIINSQKEMSIGFAINGNYHYKPYGRMSKNGRKK